MKGKSSSIFKKLLKDSGYDNKFDTIHEDEDEDLCEDCNESSSNVEKSDIQAYRRPVSPKRVRKLSTNARKMSVPKEVWLHKTPRKQCEVRHANQALNKTLNALVLRTNSLTEELNRGRQAIENALDTATRNAVRDNKTPKETGLKTTIQAPARGTGLMKRWRRTKPILVRADAKESKAQVKFESTLKAQDENRTAAIPDIKQTASPRPHRVNFAESTTLVSLHQSYPGEHVRKKVSLTEATSLPNFKLIDLRERPRSRSLNDCISTTEGVKTPPVTRNPNRLITVRPPPANLSVQRSPALHRSNTRDSVENWDSRSTASSSTASSKSERIPIKIPKRQCYNTNAGEMVRITNFLSSLASKPKPKISDQMEETWTQIRHCRYLRHTVSSPDFCTCNQCESCKKG